MAFEAPNNIITPQLTVGLPTQFNGEVNTPVQISGSMNNFYQFYVKNTSNGDTASADITVGNDIDGEGNAGHYIDMGINSSGYVGTSAATGIIKTISVTAGGTGYTVGDLLTISTGDGTANASVVTAPAGVVATVLLNENGSGYTTGTKSTTGGTGTGCTINVVSLYDLTVYAANSGYLTVTGGELVFGTDDTVASQPIKFATNGQATANERMRITDTGITVMPVTAVPAGGTAGTGLRFSSTANLGIFFGSGVPTLSAAQGSLYIRTDGSTTSTRMYINTNGATTWTAVTTAA